MQTFAIAQEVRRFIVGNYLMGRDIVFGDSDSFIEHGIIDSTAVLELVAFIEETYGIAVEDEELTPDNLDSIDRVTAYILRKLDGIPQASMLGDLEAVPERIL